MCHPNPCLYQPACTFITPGLECPLACLILLKSFPFSETSQASFPTGRSLFFRQKWPLFPQHCMQIIFIASILLVCPYSTSPNLPPQPVCLLPAGSCLHPHLSPSCLMWSECLIKMCYRTVQLSFPFFWFTFYCWRVLPPLNYNFCKVCNCLWLFTSIVTVQSPLHACSVTKLCLVLCDPMDYSPTSSSVHGISQARILEWVAIPSSRGSSQPRNWTQVSHIASGFFIDWATRKPDGSTHHGPNNEPWSLNKHW